MQKRSALPALLGILLAFTVQDQDERPFSVEPMTSFDEPWTLTFLPDGRMLVTEKKGNLRVVTQAGEQSRPVEGLPDVDYRGQGGGQLADAEEIWRQYPKAHGAFFVKAERQD